MFLPWYSYGVLSLQPNKVVSPTDIYRFGGPKTGQSVECFILDPAIGGWQLGRTGLGAAHVWKAIRVFWDLTPEFLPWYSYGALSVRQNKVSADEIHRRSDESSQDDFC